MKVLMLGWEFPPHISGGLGTACFGIARGLAQLGVEVDFVVPHAHGDEDASFGGDVLGCDRVPLLSEGRWAKSAGFDVLSVASSLQPYDTRASYSKKVELTGAYGPNLLAEVRRYARAVGEIARVREFDIIHAHDWMTFPAGIFASELSGRPLVAHIHSCEYDRAGTNVDPAICAVEQQGLALADGIVCVSRFTAGILERNYRFDPSKLTVVHNAVDAVPAQEVGASTRRKTDDPVVLFLGRVTAQKGPGVFLDAAKRVLERDSSVQFVLAGDGDLLPAMVEKAARLGIARSVRFTGFLEGEEVERAYGMADVYVMPSVSEPFGIASLEALAQNVPVILSRQSGAAETIPNALLVDSWDVDGLAEKILALISRPALRRHVLHEGRREVLGQRWEDRAGELSRLYRELAS